MIKILIHISKYKDNKYYFIICLSSEIDAIFYSKLFQYTPSTAIIKPVETLDVFIPVFCQKKQGIHFCRK